MTEQQKPKYGYVAVKFFAALAALGIVGLIVALLGWLFTQPINYILWVIGTPIAFIGLYIGIAYIFLYHLIFKVTHQGDTWSRFVKACELEGNELVLDVGCGTGGVAIGIAKSLSSGTVTGIDIFEGVSGDSPSIAQNNAEIEGVADKTAFRYGNAVDIPFDDNTFDVVTMGSVLHEIHEDSAKLQALREVFRVLKPGGKFVTLELLRTKKMFLWLLFFAFVFKRQDYWTRLLGQGSLQNLTTQVLKGPLDMGIFITEKPRTSHT